MIPALMLATAACLPPPALELAENPAPVTQGVEFLYDLRREYSVGLVAGPALCDHFVPLTTSANFGATDRGVWLRLRLPTLQQPLNQWRLLVRSNTLDRVCVHWPTPAVTFRSDCVSASDSGAAQAGLLFVVPANTEPARAVYISGESRQWLKLPLELGTADAFVRQERERQALWGWYFGLYSALILLGLVRSLVHRKPRALYGVIQLAALGLTLGLWEAYLDPVGTWGVGLTLPLLGLFVATGSLFQQHFLETAAHTPRLHRALSACAVLALLLIPLQRLPPAVGAGACALLLPAWLLTACAAAWIRRRQGQASALHLLLMALAFLPGLHLKAVDWLGRPLVTGETGSALAAAGFLVAAALLLVGLWSRQREAEQALERRREAERETERGNARALAEFNEQMGLHQAQFDPLTRLPNRGKFREDLQDHVRAAEDAGQRFAVVTFGLDNFSAINFALGYRSGDSVLVEMTRRLKEAVPAGEPLARIGPDVFAWVTAVAPADLGLRALLDRCTTVQKALAAPLELSRGITLNASIGVALYPDHGQTTEYLLRCNDAALHQAKTHQGSAIQLFESALYQRASNYLELKKEFHQSFERQQLQLHYQPIIAVLDRRLSGVEALARWLRPDSEDVPPDQFIPIAEAGDIVGPFTQWAIRTAVRQMADWRARGVPVSYVSINASAAQLRVPEFAAYFEQVLRETGLPGEHLAIEVTESNILENLDATVKTLERLRASGIRIAVDDFGVGQSSLSYLRHLPLDTLKIDRAFLRGVPRDAESRTMFEGIINLAKNLRLPTVAEGVETQQQLDFLGKHGVKSAQGFLFSRALPAPELEAWLTQRGPSARVVPLVA